MQIRLFVQILSELIEVCGEEFLGGFALSQRVDGGGRAVIQNGKHELWTAQIQCKTFPPPKKPSQNFGSP